MNKKRIIFSLILSMLILGLFASGFFIGKAQNKPIIPPENVDLSLFWQAYYTLKDKFVDKSKIKNEDLVYGAISGMVKSLGDPYTVFMPPQEAKRFLEDTKGSFEGVGMEIGIKNDQLQIVAPLEGTPAKAAGLKAGDKILKIGDTVTTDMSLDKAVSLIRGPKGTEVKLTILRNGWDSSKEFAITRAVIEVPSLTWELIGENKDIAYLKLYQFSEKAQTDFTKAAMEILNSPAKRMIFDLRNNPGGYLNVAEYITSWFVEKDQIITIEDFGGNKPKIEHKSTGTSALLKYPIVLLVNKGSASASEILAGALRDNRQVKLIGEKTFGKGSVQELANLQDGSSLKVTIAHWLTPKGTLISEVGLEPDISVSIPDNAGDKDFQLDKAIAVVNELR